MVNFQFHRSLKLNSRTMTVCLLRPDCTLSQLFILSMLVKSRPASDPVDSDLHQQSPAGETDGLIHRGFCFHTMNFDRFHLPCLLIDMLKMCCVFGFLVYRQPEKRVLIWLNWRVMILLMLHYCYIIQASRRALRRNHGELRKRIWSTEIGEELKMKMKWMAY